MKDYLKSKGFPLFWIQIILVLVIIFSRYWSKSIIRAPPPATFALNFTLKKHFKGNIPPNLAFLREN